MKDRPSGAFFLEEFSVAKNISLELVICLYPAEDVPRGIPKEEVCLSNAVGCFAWNSSFIFNPETKEFEKKSGIVKECGNIEK